MPSSAQRLGADGTGLGLTSLGPIAEMKQISIFLSDRKHFPKTAGLFLFDNSALSYEQVYLVYFFSPPQVIKQQSDESGGLSRWLRLALTLFGTAGRSVLFGQQVVFAEVAGLLVRGAYGWLGGRGVLILFASIQLKTRNSKRNRQQHV